MAGSTCGSTAVGRRSLRVSTRRAFLRYTSRCVAAAGVASLLPCGSTKRAAANVPLGKADACIFIWLGGGACHIDTWDPKRKSPDGKQPGSYYEKIPTAIPGVEVCEHLPQMAALLDRCVIIRTLHHEVIDEHAAAVNRLHTGRPPASTTIYPSIGSVVAWQLGSGQPGVPPYIVMGYPSPSRGPGFLGPAAGYLYLLDTEAGPAGLKPPPDLTAERADRRSQLLAGLRANYQARRGDSKVLADYLAAVDQAARLSSPEFMKVFDLKSEPARLREAYGSEFGQRCLLARRLVECGVRFVEVSYNLNFVNGTGWDTHNQGQLKQHLLIADLDQALSALLLDLERRQLLDRTLVVVATEFGRPPEFDAGGGRGHHSKAFSVVLAGGGLRTGQVIGQTDELGRAIVEEPVSVPDFHATIYAAVGIDPTKELYDGDRPVPITDQGTPVARLFV
ncbi:MAG: hypothetical protein KatS3mg110_0835 [Pirellulaceae bacterium]|nr:MAG: hypothetical protein KatS3mg110_0835 [Pirellulaceae bacterium]